jgi:hypothetical protein
LSPSARARLLATLPHGPRAPVVGTPPRRPGSVRRTTSIEQGWGPSDDGSTAVAGRGRDLLTRADGTTEVVDEVAVWLGVAPDGTVCAVGSDPVLDGLDGVVGAPNRSGFRAAVDAAVPDLGPSGAVLHQLLDDVPLAALIASYGMTREHEDWELPPSAADRLTDLCAGWERTGTMVGALTSTGVFPIPVGPIAPPLGDAGDPLAWHAMDELARRTVRRVRRIDVAPAAQGLLAVEAYFRDSHLGAEGPEDVLHEYTLTAIVCTAEMEVRSAEALAHTLPWPECPGALASAAQVVGMDLGEVRARVADELTGTTTCTHLNDVLRSLAGVPALASALEP